MDDAFPELIKMLQKGHLPAGGLLVVLGKRVCCGSGLRAGEGNEGQLRALIDLS
jgi:hypothetical protein